LIKTKRDQIHFISKVSSSGLTSEAGAAVIEVASESATLPKPELAICGAPPLDRSTPVHEFSEVEDIALKAPVMDTSGVDAPCGELVEQDRRRRYLRARQRPVPHRAGGLKTPGGPRPVHARQKGRYRGSRSNAVVVPRPLRRSALAARGRPKLGPRLVEFSQANPNLLDKFNAGQFDCVSQFANFL
jgi:hypothetical protein